MSKRVTRREFVQTAAWTSLVAVAKPHWPHDGETVASEKNGGSQGLKQFVDVFIGTSCHGHTDPGATVPFGMVQLSPDTWTGGWDHCSGYHHDDTSINIQQVGRARAAQVRMAEANVLFRMAGGRTRALARPERIGRRRLRKGIAPAPC